MPARLHGSRAVGLALRARSSDDGDGAGGPVQQLVADGAKGQAMEAAAAPGADDEQVGAQRGVGEGVDRLAGPYVLG